MNWKEFFKSKWKKILVFFVIFAILLTVAYSSLQENSTRVKTGITGRVYGIDDTGLGIYPLYGYSVVAIPEGNFHNWSSSIEKIGPTGFQYWEKKIEDMDPPIVFTSTDFYGYYGLELSPGTYVICFIKGSLTKNSSIGIYGCVSVSSNLHETVQVDFTASVGGYRISCPSDKCQEVELPQTKKKFIKAVLLQKYVNNYRTEEIIVYPLFLERYTEAGGKELHSHTNSSKFRELSTLIRQSGFLSLNQDYRNENQVNPVSYYISVSIDGEVKKVICYFRGCPKEFETVRSKIEEIWHKQNQNV